MKWFSYKLLLLCVSTEAEAAEGYLLTNSLFTGLLLRHVWQKPGELPQVMD